MSEQLLFKWSTFCDSSMGTKLKYLWKTHETVKSAWILSQKHVSRTMTFHVIHITWFYHGYKIETFLKNSWKGVVRQNFFRKNMSHEQLLFTWSILLASDMGTKLKYFWKSHEIVKSAWIFSQNMSHEQLLFRWSTFRDSSVGAKLKHFWKTHDSV